MTRLLHLYLLLAPFLTFGQSLTIQDLWNQSDKDLVVQQRNLQKKVKQEELNELKTNRIPVFYIDANLQRNLIIPTTPVPAIAFDPSAKDGAVVPLKFATKWSSKAGVQLEWVIFDPKQNLEYQQKDLAIQKANLNIEAYKQEWKEKATLAYAAVVLATKQYIVAQQDSIQYDNILKISKIRYEEGRETDINYRGAQQEFERKRIQLGEAWAVLLDADLELRKYIDLDSIPYLSSSIADMIALLEAYQSQNYNLSTLQVDLKDYTLQQKAIKRQLYPALKINAYFGEQYFSNEFRLDRGSEWYGNSYVNLTMRIPLSSFFTAKPTLNKILWQANATGLNIQQEQKVDHIRLQQKQAKINAAKQKLDRLNVIVDLTQSSKQFQQALYNEGRALLSDLNQSIIQVHQAQRAVWQQSFELIKLMME
ncbi:MULTISPECIES: TolC family protein [Sphingobacterium]|uniref:TolC family protein n=1 Tax=Sphingobacterium TaxID=28453 RepID=UPI0013DA569A|nr:MULTISPECIES: TolC family protein [unclassified Sphingobacterium]